MLLMPSYPWRLEGRPEETSLATRAKTETHNLLNGVFCLEPNYHTRGKDTARKISVNSSDIIRFGQVPKLDLFRLIGSCVHFQLVSTFWPPKLFPYHLLYSTQTNNQQITPPQNKLPPTRHNDKQPNKHHIIFALPSTKTKNQSKKSEAKKKQSCYHFWKVFHTDFEKEKPTDVFGDVGKLSNFGNVNGSAGKKLVCCCACCLNRLRYF